MRIRPGDIYRVDWPYAVQVEQDPYVLVLSETKFNDRYVLVVPLATADLAQSRTRVALPDEALKRKSVAHADKLTRLPVANIPGSREPVGRIDEDSFLDPHMAVGEAIGARFYPGEFEIKWKPPGTSTADPLMSVAAWVMSRSNHRPSCGLPLGRYREQTIRPPTAAS
jgi:mRNA-degrading endonuclease toxin of MazEF toxin-antitoxin module